MIREETVFGPIFSRRLGSSLGINLLPEKGKICNFDCIYCECGWNRDGRNDTVLPTAEKVRTDLERKLKECVNALMCECVSADVSNTNTITQSHNNAIPIDSITFSGDGEPTLNPEFPQIIDDSLRLRDHYYPHAKVSVLSNATRVHIPEIFNALRRVDNPIMKIDAPTNELIEKINMPAPGYDIHRVIEALKLFRGNFVLQTCMLRGNGFDSASPEVILPMMDIVRLLKPREWMVYTIDRATPMQGLQKFTPQEMKKLVQPIIDEGVTKVQIKGAVEDL
jgi:wyosine [tRNA(Phe)-imidazoG37] synthetase (radical SAM superfamily)